MHNFLIHHKLTQYIYQIRAYLIRGCLRRPDMEYPNDQWGYGAVQLMQSFHLMREL